MVLDAQIQTPEQVRMIAKLFGLCIYGLETPKGTISEYYLLRQPPTNFSWVDIVGTDGNTYQEKRDIYNPDKALHGGIISNQYDGNSYVFDEYALKNPSLELLSQIPTLNNHVSEIPNLDKSFFGEMDIEFVEVPISKLPQYLAEVFTEHNNNGRKTAVKFTPYIQEQNLN